MTATVTAPFPQQQAVLDDYLHAEDSLRAFSSRNFGRMCALCAHWTLYPLAAAGDRPAAGQQSPAAEAPAVWDEPQQASFAGQIGDAGAGSLIRQPSVEET